MRSDKPAFYPGASIKLITTNFTPNGMNDDIKWFVPHVVVGNGSLYEWFNRPSTQASSHLWVGKTGIVEQYVSFQDRAWAQVGGNRHVISAECEGYPSEPYTRAQIGALARIIIFMRNEFGIPWTITDSLDVRGIGTHKMGGAGWGGHECPGALRANQRGEIIAYAYRLVNEGENSMGIADEQIAAMNNLVEGLNPSDAARVWAETYRMVNALLKGSAPGTVRWTDANNQLRSTAVTLKLDEVLEAIAELKADLVGAITALHIESTDMDGLAKALARELLQALASE